MKNGAQCTGWVRRCRLTFPLPLSYNRRSFLPPAPGSLEFTMKAYMCVICGYVYEEEKGDAASGLAAGTRWDDVPLSWRCPDCGAGKEDFEMIEV